MQMTSSKVWPKKKRNRKKEAYLVVSFVRYLNAKYMLIAWASAFF